MTSSKQPLLEDDADGLQDTDLPQELNFDEDRSKPPRRDRTGGNASDGVVRRTPNSDVTGDDLSPETMLDDGGVSIDAGAAADTALSDVGMEGIGSGGGLDEAELAEVDPVGRKASRRLHENIERHAADSNAVEPAEAEVQRQARKDRR